MSSINPHKTLALSFEHGLSRIWEPSIDEVTVEAVTVANLFTFIISRVTRRVTYRGLSGEQLTSPHASLKGGTPVQP
jgi:hypothetical protein